MSNTDAFASTLHRDGSATVCNVHRQGWTRICATDNADGILSELGWQERERVERHFARHTAKAAA